MKRLPIVLIILIRRDPRRAYQIFSTAKPSMKDAANRNSAALITNENRPRVRIVIGRVSINRIGRIIVLKKPSTMAAIVAGYNPSTVIPETRFAIKISPRALNSNLRISVISIL
ncbi:MAG: hypothetical protein ACI9BF_000150 [Candidatus Paceibacteria bacterium]|jgi:hypothetical protein